MTSDTTVSNTNNNDDDENTPATMKQSSTARSECQPHNKDALDMDEVRDMKWFWKVVEEIEKSEADSRKQIEALVESTRKMTIVDAQNKEMLAKVTTEYKEALMEQNTLLKRQKGLLEKKKAIIVGHTEILDGMEEIARENEAERACSSSSAWQTYYKD